MPKSTDSHLDGLIRNFTNSSSGEHLSARNGQEWTGSRTTDSQPGSTDRSTLKLFYYIAGGSALAALVLFVLSY